MKETIEELFERDVLKVIDELKLYTDEESIWKLVPGINNSAGTLFLHLAGNLHHFIGALLGHTGYIRDRDSEFSSRNVSRKDMIASLESVRLVIHNTFCHLKEEDLDKTFPVDKHGQTVTTSYMMLHLLTHLNYHLGQINYHRRILSGK